MRYPRKTVLFSSFDVDVVGKNSKTAVASSDARDEKEISASASSDATGEIEISANASSGTTGEKGISANASSDMTRKKGGYDGVRYDLARPEGKGVDATTPSVSYGDLSRYYERPRGARAVLSFVLYRLLATPTAVLHSALVTRQRIIGRGKLPRGGYLLVGNHTERCGDAFTPSLVAFPRRTSVVVHPDNVTLPVLRRITPLMGALPIPDGLRSAHAYSLFAAKLLSSGEVLALYPEAHLWPKCGFLRPFNHTAFDPAVRGGFPVYTATRVYKKHRLFGYVTRVYIDGPFLADPSLPRSRAAVELGSRVYSAMSERLIEGDVTVIEYKQKEEK